MYIRFLVRSTYLTVREAPRVLLIRVVTGQEEDVPLIPGQEELPSEQPQECGQAFRGGAEACARGEAD